MFTKLWVCDPIDPESEIIEQVANILLEGGLVAFPTETVYGLGANGLNEKAIHDIFLAKGRPQDNPLILHVSSMEMAQEYTNHFSDAAKILAQAFWPGPLSMVFKKSQKIPAKATAGLDTVALRVPLHPIALALIQKANVPIAAPSANVSGKPSPTTAQHVKEDLSGKIHGIIDGGQCMVGLESTVIDMTTDVPKILRPGMITLDDIKKKLPDTKIHVSNNTSENPLSPGMKYQHYAPDAPLILVKGSKKNAADYIKKQLNNYQNPGILCTQESLHFYPFSNVMNMGSANNVHEIAHNLFYSLRLFNQMNVDVIFCEYIEKNTQTEAILNRLIKASGNHLIEL